jgi:hypothetical protein
MNRDSKEDKPTISRQEAISKGQMGASNRIDRIMEHEEKEKSRAKKIASHLSQHPLSMADLMGIDDGNVPQLTRAQLFDGMEIPRQQVLTERFPVYDESSALFEKPKPPAPISKPIKQNTAMWGIKQYMAEMRNGGEIPVWKVSNSSTGFALDKVFRIKEVAQKLVMILNETGNINDTRVVSLINSYDKRDKLLKEIRVLQKDPKDKPMKTKIIESKRAEIAQLEYRLGI